MDISLLNISLEIDEWELKYEEKDKKLLEKSKTVIPEGNIKKKVLKGDKKGGQNDQENGMLLVQERRKPQKNNEQAAVNQIPTEKKQDEIHFIPTDILTMSGSQMISIFSRITGLYSIWNGLTLTDKLKLWFGENKSPYLKVYHKLAFWNQAGWDKRTFQKLHQFKEDLGKTDFNIEIFKISSFTSVKVQETTFEKAWEDLNTCPRHGNDEANFQDNSDLVLNPSQIRFVQSLLRGEKNLYKQFNKQQTQEKKLKLLKCYFVESVIQHEHKLIIWFLMSQEEKLQLIKFQEKKVQSEFMMLLFIEEQYDNFIMLSKMEMDLVNSFKNTIYRFYHKFSEYNSLHEALKIRLKFTKSAENQIKDYYDYILFLEGQINNTNHSIQKYSEFLLEQLKQKNLGNQIGLAQPQKKSLFSKIQRAVKNYQKQGNQIQEDDQE